MCWGTVVVSITVSSNEENIFGLAVAAAAWGRVEGRMWSRNGSSRLLLHLAT